MVQEGKSDFKYYRHHKSSFLELGLVKAAFLWELLRCGHVRCMHAHARRAAAFLWELAAQVHAFATRASVGPDLVVVVVVVVVVHALSLIWQLRL